jgi:hypothetical protein
MTNNVKIHNSKDTIWTNATGDQVPLKFVPKTDKVKESLAGKIYKAAKNAEATLNELYTLMQGAFDEVRDLIKDEYSIKYNKEKKSGKGSITWFNFDRSIKIEANVNDLVKWDNALMTQALELLNDYLSQNLTEANELIAGLVKSAFANSKGMIDTGKVFQILKYQDKIKQKSFQKACELMKNAQSIDRTKLYMRVFEKDASGQYININLNFSSLTA